MRDGHFVLEDVTANLTTESLVEAMLPADFSFRNMDLLLEDEKSPTKQLAKMLRPMADDNALASRPCMFSRIRRSAHTVKPSFSQKSLIEALVTRLPAVPPSMVATRLKVAVAPLARTPAVH